MARPVAQGAARRLDEPVAASLDARVPPGNFSRHPDAKLDLDVVRE